MTVRISLVLCTRNRLEALRASLPQALATARAADYPAEVLIVDNGSTDGTAEWLSGLQDPIVRVVTARFAGLSRARNVGCLSARGDVIVFTDDDVVVHTNWLNEMTVDIICDRADAVAARVVLHSSLDEFDLSDFFRRRLAETAGVASDNPPLVGAGMAFRRTLLEVAQWDPDLGAGVAGTSFGEDVLFEWMVKASGARVRWADGEPIVHQPTTDRLNRDAWLALARAHGKTDAYIGHHWLGAKVSLLPLRLVRNVARLKLYQLRNRPKVASEAEMELVTAAEMSRHLLRERRTPAKYRPHG